MTGQPEPMSEKDMRESGACIDVFGLPLVGELRTNTHICEAIYTMSTFLF